MSSRPGMQYNPAGRYAYRPTKAGIRGGRGPIVKAIPFTVRCGFCYAHYAAKLGPRIACPVCGRVEAER